MDAFAVNNPLQAQKEQKEFTSEHEAYLRCEIARAIEQLDQKHHADFTAETIIAECRRAHHSFGNFCP